MHRIGQLEIGRHEGVRDIQKCCLWLIKDIQVRVEAEIDILGGGGGGFQGVGGMSSPGVNRNSTRSS